MATMSDESLQARSLLSSAKDTETLRKMMKLQLEHEERMELKTRKHQMWMKQHNQMMLEEEREEAQR